MNTKQALEIVVSAAKANANGHERCAEILEACAMLSMPMLHECWRCKQLKPDCAPDEGDCGWWCPDCIKVWENENNQHWEDGSPLSPISAPL